jgi:hypothetical protein
MVRCSNLTGCILLVLCCLYMYQLYIVIFINTSNACLWAYLVKKNVLDKYIFIIFLKNRIATAAASKRCIQPLLYFNYLIKTDKKPYNDLANWSLRLRCESITQLVQHIEDWSIKICTTRPCASIAAIADYTKMRQLIWDRGSSFFIKKGYPTSDSIDSHDHILFKKLDKARQQYGTSQSKYNPRPYVSQQ